MRDPFRKPDAFHGGARTREEALEEAERAAGVHLIELEPRWARAWARILVGQPPWREKKIAGDAESGARHSSKRRPTKETPRASVWAILGIPAQSSVTEIKRAYRKRALETHPDHGGDPEAFRTVQRAYEEALVRAVRRG